MSTGGGCLSSTQGLGWNTDHIVGTSADGINIAKGTNHSHKCFASDGI